MLMIISPAKTFKEPEGHKAKPYESLTFKEEIKELIVLLKEYNPLQLAKLMKMSEKLGEINYERYRVFNKKDSIGYEAIKYFYGEAYKGIDVATLSEATLQFMEEHVRILSGLYGALKPLDIIKEYRLEMGTKLANKQGDNLYAYWKQKISDYIIEALHETSGDKVLLNLASEEYSKVLDLKKLEKDYKMVTISFKEYNEGNYKIVGMYAKKARGMMVRYLCEKGAETLEEVKAFQSEGYRFNEVLSSEKQFVFTR